MSVAIEVRGLSKRFLAGSHACRAAAEVLREVNLSVRAGETVAIVGDVGAGKSTLLLCLAGLLSPDRGEVRWFGDASRAAAARRAVYHVASTDLMRAGRIEEPNVHLVDLHDGGIDARDLERWVAARRAAGDAVIVAQRDGDAADARSRVLRLRHGTLHEQFIPRPRVRVAEPRRQ